VKLFCIGDEDTVRAFGLAGVTGKVAPTAGDASAVLEQAVARPDCGIIILTDKVAASIRQQVDAIRLERERPLLLEIPGPDGAMPGRKSLRQFVQEAIGISLDSKEGGEDDDAKPKP
jgi:V/A-type H+/Na+-transporting ATPase subunit F